MTARARLLLLGLVVTLVSACAGPVAPPDVAAPPADVVAGLEVEVHRSATCGCCEGYEDYLRAAGVVVTEVIHDDIAAYKREAGIPEAVWSCHTNVVAGYLVEGHVPLQAIVDLLHEAPDVEGIALPGMPAGSPGMSGEKSGPWRVVTIDGGSVGEFGEY